MSVLISLVKVDVKVIDCCSFDHQKGTSYTDIGFQSVTSYS